MQKTCNTCGGTGMWLALDNPICCPDCNGVGYVDVEEYEDDNDV